MPKGYISGLEITLNTSDTDHDIDIAAGVARDDGNAANLILSSAITKRIDASWAVGNGNGGLDTGSVAADTAYFIYEIKRSDTGVVDVLISASSSSPTLPSGYDQKQLIGYLSTDGSANIAHIFQREGPCIGTPVSTSSGTSFAFLNIPTWVKKITVNFSGVSLDGTDSVLVQIGDSGGIETSGYTSSSVLASFSNTTTGATSTAGYILFGGASARFVSGSLIISLMDESNHTWAAAGAFFGASTLAGYSGGVKSLSAALDRLTVTRSGTDNFDAGTINVLLE